MLRPTPTASPPSSPPAEQQCERKVKNMKKLSGLIPPMVTPLNARRGLDKVGVRNMVKHLLDGGVDGIFLLGTTG
ncbi:MAG: dihydrodipicolinate synthase family protein, partial [Kiritimatiellae bacterium]|nr:dihydrodipicolinate synthase family protein [Kiritimatiellia bacterium]